MIAVSDTSPLNYLVMIGAVDLLPDLFGNIVIPGAVRDELSNPRAPDPVRQWIAHFPPWLDVRNLKFKGDKTLDGLQQGERDSIFLAEMLGADLVLLDEKTARTVAQERGLQVTGTLGLLDLAGLRGLIDIPQAVDLLRQTTFRATPALYKLLLDPSCLKSLQTLRTVIR